MFRIVLGHVHDLLATLDEPERRGLDVVIELLFKSSLDVVKPGGRSTDSFAKLRTMLYHSTQTLYLQELLLVTKLVGQSGKIGYRPSQPMRCLATSLLYCTSPMRRKNFCLILSSSSAEKPPKLVFAFLIQSSSDGVRSSLNDTSTEAARTLFPARA